MDNMDTQNKKLAQAASGSSSHNNCYGWSARGELEWQHDSHERKTISIANSEEGTQHCGCITGAAHARRAVATILTTFIAVQISVAHRPETSQFWLAENVFSQLPAGHLFRNSCASWLPASRS